jgi:hypothetical protein
MWTEKHCSLESQLKEYEIRFEGIIRENEGFQSLNQQLQQQLEIAQNEKEEMITKHTLETGELRRKITVLKEQLESSPITAPSHQSDFTDFATELEGLNMGSETDWTNWVTDFATEVEHPQEMHSKSTNAETTLVVGQRRKDTLMSDASEKQMASGGFLLLFLLYGAFVATRATTATTLPPISDEYRAEAANILNHVLDDGSGMQQSSMNMLQAAGATGIQQMVWPQPSNTQSASRPAFSHPANAGGLNALSQQMLTPSKQQEAEAAFSMTPAQYNSMTSTDFTRRSFESTDETSRPTQSTRKTLADMIKANREETQRGSNVAEVYTRSLMWDRIPTDVVQEFKRMVSRCPSTDENDVKTEYDE